MREIKYIIIHCTASQQTKSVEQIQKDWKDGGWKFPGYHFIIKPNGALAELHPIEKPSNGVKGYNANSIHISYIGGVDRDNKPFDNRTDSQKKAMYELVKMLKGKFPQAEIKGHRDFSPDLDGDGIIEKFEWLKACPSFEVSEWVKQVGL